MAKGGKYYCIVLPKSYTGYRDDNFVSYDRPEACHSVAGARLFRTFEEAERHKDECNETWREHAIIRDVEEHDAFLVRIQQGRLPG